MSEIQANSRSELRILVVRPDRLGDVILSTPVLNVIKRQYPRSHVTFMVREPVDSVVRGLPSVDSVFLYEPQGRHRGAKGFFRLVSELRRERYRIAVVLQSQWRIAAAVFLARVRYRLGPLSKLHSFLFYNRGVRQHRSQVEMHEADYNLQLLRRLGIRVGSRNIPTSVGVSDETKKEAGRWLSEQGWKSSEPLVAVHPGMGGSALNWPENHYIELIRALIRDGRQVLVTGGPTEKALLDRVRAALGPASAQAWFYLGPDGKSLSVLAGLFSHCSLVVAPSTGPLHVAVALGKPVVTFYPPIRVQSALRWGPYLRDERKASVLIPEVYCGQDFKCKGSLCNYYSCMKGLTVAQALQEVNSALSRAESSLES